ncbi:hypothetical protein P280DRAFT_12060 [Massarina eburnea CBS 473.64]|uniref:Uncharacterized protein n=1 Tax=Massarina eburnea CBS 473.64 TaxID=1395130 RepID=A0A6A6SFZ3_9PLEO|nr:hypothetical protein P280DRAFT_12060 [Massarina eburnea CBS 473.64]
MGSGQYGLMVTKNKPEYVWIVSRSFTPGEGFAYVYQVGLVPHVQIVDDRRLVQMRELGHVVGLVELGRIDLVDRVGLDLVLLAIVALDQQQAVGPRLDDPATHEGRLRVPQPDIALAREVVLALNGAHLVVGPVFYELGRKRAGRRAVAVRVGARARGVGPDHGGAAEVGERLVAGVAHAILRFVERRGQHCRLGPRGGRCRCGRGRGRIGPRKRTVAPSVAVRCRTSHGAGCVLGLGLGLGVWGRCVEVTCLPPRSA